MASQTNASILYVDDEYDNLVVFSSRFKKRYDVHIARDANEALQILENTKIQLVVSDQRMPGMTGVQLLEIVKEKYPDVVRIILTGHTDPNEIIHAINKSNIYYFVRKPWDGQELQLLIDKSLAYYNLRQRNKELLQRLYVTINELEIFYYRASHDLRGPIASLMGLLLLAKNEKGIDQMNTYLDMLEDCAHKLEEVIRKISSVSLVEQANEDEEVIDLNEVLQDVLRVLGEEIAEKSIRVDLSIAPNINYTARRSLIKNLFENLIENSVHFSDTQKESKQINIVVSSKTGLLIEIIDNGVGIESSKIDSIFHAFYRGNESSKGNGLGLYIVKKTVDVLGGKISVSSSPFVGTSMRIELPETKPEKEKVTVGADNPHASNTSHGMNMEPGARKPTPLT